MPARTLLWEDTLIGLRLLSSGVWRCTGTAQPTSVATTAAAATKGRPRAAPGCDRPALCLPDRPRGRSRPTLRRRLAPARVGRN